MACHGYLVKLNLIDNRNGGNLFSEEVSGDQEAKLEFRRGLVVVLVCSYGFVAFRDHDDWVFVLLHSYFA